MKFYLYILYSDSYNRYYIGVSNDPQRRLQFHNIGKSGSNRSFTKRATDWKIVYKEMYNTKSEARYREKFIKNKKSRKFIEMLITNIGQ